MIAGVASGARAWERSALAGVLCRLLLAAGLAALVWLPWPVNALRTAGRQWAAVCLGLMLILVLALVPLPGEGVLVRGPRPARALTALLLAVGSGAVVALTGGWDSPLEFLYIVPALSLDATATAAGVVTVSAVALAEYVAAGLFAGRAMTNPALASIVVGRAGLWAALSGAVVAVRAARARRRAESEYLRQLARHAEAQMLSLERARGELLAHVSHELMTPLAAIRAGASMLADWRSTSDHWAAQATREAACRRLALNVHRNATRLAVLVEDLLELARLEEGQNALRPAWHPCALVLQRATEAVAVLAEGHQQELTWSVASVGLQVWGDARRIEQVLVNLLANAHKYAGEGAHIALTARAERQGVALEVCDDGPGLAPDAVAHLFDRYYRGPGSPGQGTGLGLAIAGALADLHQGSISVANTSGSGCRFTFWLPDPSARRRQGEEGATEDEQ